MKIISSSSSSLRSSLSYGGYFTGRKWVRILIFLKIVKDFEISKYVLGIWEETVFDIFSSNTSAEDNRKIMQLESLVDCSIALVDCWWNI